MLESEGICVIWIESGKTTNKFADTSRLLKKKKKKKKKKNLCSPAKFGPGIVKSLQSHIRMPKWLYFKALYHSIHDVLLLSI